MHGYLFLHVLTFFFCFCINEIPLSLLQLVPSKQHKQTVGSQFRESLTKLIETLHSTTPHYVRCIKPNDDKEAFKWDPPKIVQQLRACGVLETIRISAAGFPSRWQYDQFYDRYRLLCKRSQIVEWNEQATCTNIVNNCIGDADKYRFGNTQIFFRAGQVAYLEQLRSETRCRHIVVVQSMVRRFVHRTKYLKLRRSVLGIQQMARGYLARRRADAIRKTRAAIRIQRVVRGWLCRRIYQRLRRSILGIQTVARGRLARVRFRAAMDNYRATTVQRYCRGYLSRFAFRQKLRRIILCQSTIRRFLARRRYKKLRAEARTISHMQKMYKGLENKIISLQQRIDVMAKDNEQLRQQNKEIPELKARLEVMRALDIELKTLRARLIERETDVRDVRTQIEMERDEKMALLEEKERDEKLWVDERAKMMAANVELQAEVGRLVNAAKEEAVAATLQRSRVLLDVESNEIHQAYQRSLKDKEMIAIENAALHEENKRLSGLVHQLGHGGNAGHSRSISNASSINNDEDFGYSSSRNTMELRRATMLTPQSAAEKLDDSSSAEQHQRTPDTKTSKYFILVIYLL